MSAEDGSSFKAKTVDEFQSIMETEYGSTAAGLFRSYLQRGMQTKNAYVKTLLTTNVAQSMTEANSIWRSAKETDPDVIARSDTSDFGLRPDWEDQVEKDEDPCWEGYTMVGRKDNGDPRCVPEEDVENYDADKSSDDGLRPNWEERVRKDEDPCWDGYTMVGLKENGNPRCVPEEDAEDYDADKASKDVEPAEGLEDACWDGYVAVGMKEGENGEMVPDCVPADGKAARTVDKEFELVEGASWQETVEIVSVDRENDEIVMRDEMSGSEWSEPVDVIESKLDALAEAEHDYLYEMVAAEYPNLEEQEVHEMLHERAGLETRDIEASDEPDGGEEDESARKRRVYVDHPSEVPAEYMGNVQQGSRPDVFYYETDPEPSGSVASELVDALDDLISVEDGDDPSIETMRERAGELAEEQAELVRAKMAEMVGKDRVYVSDPRYVPDSYRGSLQEGKSGELYFYETFADGSRANISESVAKEIEEIVSEIDVAKDRVYVDSPAEVPEGREVQEGQTPGTYYYETGGGSGDSLLDTIDDELPVSEQAGQLVDEVENLIDADPERMADDFADEAYANIEQYGAGDVQEEFANRYAEMLEEGLMSLDGVDEVPEAAAQEIDMQAQEVASRVGPTYEQLREPPAR